MDDDKIKLMDVELSKEQLISLFNIAVDVSGLARHDLKNSRARIHRLLQNTLELFNSMSQESSGRDTLQEFIPDAIENIKEALKRISDALELLDEYFEFYTDPTFDGSFVARPQKIVEAIRKFHEKSDIVIGETSPISLGILYPSNTLFGILRELIENAAKHNKFESKILIEWSVEGENFQCEVHDNGVGLAPTVGRSFYPLDALLNRDDVNLDEVSGLKHVFRVVTHSNGILLFSNSQILGGTLVYFKIPILGYNLQ
jgi:signal transduction histidine kinase